MSPTMGEDIVGTADTSLRTHGVFFLCGIAPSWILVDGIFAQIYTFDRSQPEGLALATYLGALSASVNTVVVPAYDAAQRWLQWPMRRWVQVIAYVQIGACAIAAAAWPLQIGGYSIVLYLVMLVASFAGNGQQLVLLPWLADDCDNKRIAMAMAGGQTGVLIAAGFSILQTTVDSLSNPSYCFVFIGLMLIASSFAIRETVAFTTALKDDTQSAARLATVGNEEKSEPTKEATGLEETSATAHQVVQSSSINPLQTVDEAALPSDALPNVTACDEQEHRSTQNDSPVRDADETGASIHQEAQLSAVNPLQIRDDAVHSPNGTPIVTASDEEKQSCNWSCCAAPFLAFRDGSEPWRREMNAIAWSNAYLQLVAWVFMRSTLPYTFKAVRPRSAGKDGGTYLSIAVNLSLVSCFIGAILANRQQSSVNLTMVNLLSTFSFGLIGLCALLVRPPADTPAYTIAAILAAVVVRGLDGYCSPIFYRTCTCTSLSKCLSVRRSCSCAIEFFRTRSPSRCARDMRRDGRCLDHAWSRSPFWLGFHTVFVTNFCSYFAAVRHFAKRRGAQSTCLCERYSIYCCLWNG